MRQQLERRLAVADEIVIDKINRTPNAALKHFIEFGRDLLRGFQPRVAAVKSRNIAELALIGTAARILDAAEEIAPEVGKLIGWKRKPRHVEPV